MSETTPPAFNAAIGKGSESLFASRRWRVRIRFLRYSRGEIVAETNTSETFWFKRNAKSRSRDLNRTPGYVTTVERS